MSQPPANKKRPSSTQNIKVVVRVRPLNKEEIEKKVKSVVSCVSLKEILTKEKKYQFDRVFQPDSSQMDIYSYVVAPMISDVLEGYNCTVFAYGQTGTGKTHTMTGGDPTLSANVHWRTDDLAGCIPRAAANIFDEIGLMDAVDYNVRVSFLELYNEEVRDLLCEEERPSPLNLFNDSKGSIYIQNLNEITVFSSQDIYILLQKGTHKRQTASTLMNNHSSRSHTVFTITVHIREVTMTGEDVLKSGKINLVDLAGSENIAKSGAKDKRAQELANINRSLLTLGRVIQILAEKNNKHVPYRDSKLTRILQDSLGGHTKTCIIATISPSSSSFEETQSTLDYACRARDIRNTPTVNEKVTKQQMIKDMGHEIEKLKKDLEAARTGTGVYIDKENWEQINSDIQSTAYTLNLKNEVIDDMKKKLAELEQLRDTKIKEFDQIMNVCMKKDKIIEKAKHLLSKMTVNLKQEEYISNYYAVAANETTLKAKELFETTKKLSVNQEILQRKLENQYYTNYTNEKIVKEKSVGLSQTISSAAEKVEDLRNSSGLRLNNVRMNLDFLASTQADAVEAKKLSFETQTKTALESMVKRVTCRSEFNIGKIDNVLGLVEYNVQDCSNTSSEFESYDRNVTSKMKSFTDVIAVLYSGLQQQRQEEIQQLQDLEKFSDITRSRIKQVEHFLGVIESSNVLGMEQKVPEKTVIEQKLCDMKNRSETTTHELCTLRNSLKLEPEICSQYESEIIEVENSDIKMLETQVVTMATKIDDTRQEIASLEEEIESYTTQVSVLAREVDNALKHDIVSSIIPVQRGGDTPKQNNLNLPKRMGETTLPRDVLVKRFKDEFSPNIENESFHLNISTDSIQPLEDDSNEESRESLESSK